VLTALALHHRYAQFVQMPPARLQTAPVMAIAGELVGIAAAIVGTLPIEMKGLDISISYL